jgi:pimeloyl-ACP methyl ester carboxylesterase
VQFIDSDGLKIYFEQHGEGHPMILAHGWGADSISNWVETGWVDTLKSLRTLIYIDIRGHGKSDKPHALAPYSYSAMSRDVIAVMDALNVEKADFMGYSMGAFMGAYLLGHHPERFTSMVLGGIGNETDASAAQGAVIADALRVTDVTTIKDPGALATRHFVAANPRNDLLALACSAEKMWPEGYPLELAGENISAAKLPVLIVNGDADFPYVNRVNAFLEALPNARYLKLLGKDHLTAVPDPQFKAFVVSFLQTQNRAPDK